MEGSHLAGRAGRQQPLDPLPAQSFEGGLVGARPLFGGGEELEDDLAGREILVTPQVTL